MNKQEIIEKIKQMTVETLFSGTLFVKQKEVIKLIEQLDELEKVTIPKFVADWIKYCKFTHVDLQHSLIVGDVYFYNYANQKDFSKLKEFLETENNQATFARAWLDGYEIEKPKYVVTDGNHLYFRKYQEDVEIIILADEQPGTMDYVKKFDTREEAKEVADILGWKVKEVHDD